MNGTVTTTSSTRTLCAVATRSMRAPWRSARLAISLAPPIAEENHAVLKSTSVYRRRIAVPMNASATAKNMPTRIGPALLPIWPITCGVKYRPSDVPITHCPPLRAGLGEAVPSPRIRVAAVRSSAPSIQGKGMFTHTASNAPISAIPKPPATRTSMF
ncbi:hypothetical protein D3C72_1719060 [compost metagenome]